MNIDLPYMELTHVSLFTGIGGIDLAAEWTGFNTVLMVERDDYCQKVLNKLWPNVPIIGDIKDVTKEIVDDTISRRWGTPQNRKICEDGVSDTSINTSHDERRRNNESIPPITLITGGFPCQPFSHAGQRKGEADDRYLWPEMLRVISEFRPTWVIGENVGGLVTMGIKYNDADLEGEISEQDGDYSTVVLDRVCTDFENLNYEVQPFLIPACAVNAPHRRDRIFIVAYSKHSRDRTPRNGSVRNRTEIGERQDGQPQYRIGRLSQDVADTNRVIRGTEWQDKFWGQSRYNKRVQGLRQFNDWWATEPDVGRVAHGIPCRVDRLRCLGNAVVPQQIYPILKAIADIER